MANRGRFCAPAPAWPAGTVAIDYAVNHGEDLERLVLIDAQVCGCTGAGDWLWVGAKAVQRGSRGGRRRSLHRCNPRSQGSCPPCTPLQGFIDGIGPLASMPRFLSVLGVQVLRSVPLRQMANQVQGPAGGAGRHSRRPV